MMMMMMVMTTTTTTMMMMMVMTTTTMMMTMMMLQSAVHAALLVLLENGIDLSVRNRKLRTAYDCAIGKGHFELASTLDGSMPPEQARRFYTEKIGEKYGPYLISAVLKNDKAKLIEAEGDSALNLAIKSKKLRESGQMLDVVKFLSNCGADPSFKDLDGKDAFDMAEERGYEDVLNILRGPRQSYKRKECVASERRKKNKKNRKRK
nr:hypothetical protein BaRGS_027869 [Batillaria attramentaria]